MNNDTTYYTLIGAGLIMTGLTTLLIIYLLRLIYDSPKIAENKNYDIEAANDSAANETAVFIRK